MLKARCAQHDSQHDTTLEANIELKVRKPQTCTNYTENFVKVIES